MRLLILGGTLYLGRHLVEAATARGHTITLFHRGRTNPDLFPEHEHVLGDREQGLEALRGRTWDAVVDTSGYLPRVVRDGAETLCRAVGHYTFISTLSVYADNTKPGITESDAVAEPAEGTPEALTAESYGPLKARCEQIVTDAMPERSLVVRPGLVFGPHDPTERSGYWPRRVAAGGDVLAPGRPERPIQLVDVRDLAQWIVRMAESGTTGIYNATGPDSPLTMARFLSTCRDVTQGDARFVWVDEEFLVAREVGPYSELPLWIPERYQAFGTVDCHAAFAAGLTFRPLADTVRDTWDWDASLPRPRAVKTKVSIPLPLSGDRERTLLAEWREQGRVEGAGRPLE
jgi:2'-hydroxyisoflavone reductase